MNFPHIPTGNFMTYKGYAPETEEMEETLCLECYEYFTPENYDDTICPECYEKIYK